MYSWDQICILYGFPCEMDFSHHESPCGENSVFISHGKPYKMHFLAYFALQYMLVMLNTLLKLKIMKTMWDGFISKLFSTWENSETMRERENVLHDRCPYMTGVLTWQVSLHDRCPYMTGVLTWQVSLHDRCPYMTGVLTWRVSIHHRFFNMGQIAHSSKKLFPHHHQSAPWSRFYCN